MCSVVTSFSTSHYTLFCVPRQFLTFSERVYKANTHYALTVTITVTIHTFVIQYNIEHTNYVITTINSKTLN